MTSRSSKIPSYRLHKPSGKAVVTIPLPGGSRRDVYLGEHNSPDSRREYARLIAELATTPAAALVANPNRPIEASVDEVLLAFWKFAEQHYRRADGSQTHEVMEYKQSFKPLRALYGQTAAADFGPLALKTVRQRMIEHGLCRRLINQRIGRIRRAFKWAASEQMIPVAVYQALATVEGLQRGRTNVREIEPVKPVEEAIVDATLPFLPRQVRGMVELQRLTGCRPGEACAIRRRDIDTGGAIWLYRPSQHKTAWRGKSRIIAIGPKAQERLREYFTPNLDDYLFSPRRTVEEFRAERTSNRKTPCYASHMKRNALKRVNSPKRVPAEVYDVSSYGHAIKRACAKAFPLPPALAQRSDESRAAWWGRLTPAQQVQVRAWRRTHSWHPNRLRHSHATKVRKSFGLEHAGASLGHSKMSATEIYAERDAGLAVEVAAKLG